MRTANSLSLTKIHERSLMEIRTLQEKVQAADQFHTPEPAIGIQPTKQQIRNALILELNYPGFLDVKEYISLSRKSA